MENTILFSFESLLIYLKFYDYLESKIKVEAPDYFYEATKFSLLKKKNLGKELEVFDLFQNHEEELFIRIRNRQEPELLGSAFEHKEAKIDLKNTFIFDLEGNQKYTLSGLQKKNKNQRHTKVIPVQSLSNPFILG